ncbi:tripartite motif-containing protein 16-like [Nematolebias whitei]|uniref:tripartite motif-containing protein 16-like n=1 Tax=Nematolebias whitei TaxID=451745 RepID=UPI00189C557A|nr:tripartite motif-containing protein 16-like [Nematolebias whitei]
MAQKGVELDADRFSCPICLEVLEVPVALPCGHSYCMKCIKDVWNKKRKKKVSSCPECRQTFTPRPALVKNNMLADLVEQLKTTGLQADPDHLACPGPEDVACDVCSGRKLKAVRSCLVCLASYCDRHLQPHYDAAPLRRHKLVEPSTMLQVRVCSRHDEVMKVFCCTDQQCVCVLCTMDDHKDHETVWIQAARAEKQKELEADRQQLQQRIKDQEEDLKVLQQEVEAIDAAADKQVESSKKMFAELIRLIQRRSSDVEQQVRSQQKTEASRVRELQEKLEQEITELRRKDSELEQLSRTEDHNQFLQSYVSRSALGGSPHSASITAGPHRYFEDVAAAVLELRDRLQDALSEKWTNISQVGSDVHVLTMTFQSEPQTRADFLSYSCELTLDPDTAYRTLLLSQNHRAAMVEYEQESYTSNPQRFTHYRQVLSKERLTGCCYWEVKWAGVGLCVAVTYKNIRRAGNSLECAFGFNDKSWVLQYDMEGCRFTPTSYTFYHNKVKTSVSGPESHRLGVYLDHRAGTLCFYDVSQTMTLLHRVRTTFTQPLYAGFRFCYCDGGDIEFVEPEGTDTAPARS